MPQLPINLAQCLPLWALGPLLAQPYWSFVDNTAAQHALVRGYSTNPAGNFITGAFWAAAARLGAGPWFHRVSSKDNISHGISRLDHELAVQAGWRQLEFDFSRVYAAIVEAVALSPLDPAKFLTAVLDDLAAQRLRLGLPAA